MQNVNEHFALQNDFHASCASYLKNTCLEDGVGILNRLLQGKQGFLCFSIELENKARVFGSISSGLE